MLENEEKKAILDRAKAALGFATDKELVEHLEISPQVLVGWKTRNQIDFTILKEKLSPEQFIRAVYDQSVILSGSMALPDFVTRAEYMAGVVAVNQRVDRLTQLLAEHLETAEAHPEPDPEG
jgi:hypothetical protein